MASAGRDDREGGDLFACINVTPLVDITLVLLIVFMVAAPLMIESPAIKVNLPRTTTAEHTQPSKLALTMQRDSGGGYRLFANGRDTDEARVRVLVAGLVGKDPELQAVIAADKGIAYGDVMHVVDVVRASGVSRFALHTESLE
jgi:biopolymer transport protein ExbD